MCIRDSSSDDVVVNFKNTNKLDKSRRYVLPVTITDADIEVQMCIRDRSYIGYVSQQIKVGTQSSIHVDRKSVV